MNVFDDKFSSAKVLDSNEEKNGWNTLVKFGVGEDKIQKFKELKLAQKKLKAEKAQFKPKL